MNKYFLYGLKFSVSIALIFWIFRRINIDVLKNVFFSFSLQSLSWILLISFLQTFLMGVRWYYIQQKWSSTQSLRTSLKFMWMAQFFSQFMPGGILAGDLVRGWYLKSTHLTLKDISQILISEKLFLALGLLVFCMPYCFFDMPPLLGALSVLAFICLGSTFFMFKKASPLSYDVKNVFFIFAISCVINALACLSLYILMYDFNPNTSLLSSFILMPVITFVSILPISFGGWGLREGAMIYFLRDLGFSSEISLGIGLALFFGSFLSSLPGFFTWLSIHKKKS